MKVVQINNLCGRGSTGKIALEISHLSFENGIDNFVIYFSRHSDYFYSKKLSNKIYIKFQALKSRLLGNYGFNSYLLTKRLIRELEMQNPDLIHVHNIHAHNIHFGLFFQYVKKRNLKVIYTFHDCWPFTGYCPHFLMAKCEKWKCFCSNCPLKKEYSWFFDRSRSNFIRKKNALTDLELTIVTPSKWLSNIIGESFLKAYPVRVINNGIDLQIFKPTDGTFRRERSLEKKFIVLGVADSWSTKKGLDIFVKLSKDLPSNYQIVMVGTDKRIDKDLPSKIISIHRTQNQNELADIYSSADIFLNPTREDNYPTVNMESLACGTPVLTFDVGGSSEIIDETCGSAVRCDDYGTLLSEIVRICETKCFSLNSCLLKAKEFDKKTRLSKYIELYKELLHIENGMFDKHD